MARKDSVDRSIAHGRGDPIRIVALYLPKEVFSAAPGIAALPPPQLTYRGGLLMRAVEVFTVFWRGAWKTAAPLGLAKNINKFSQFILRSPLLDQMAEYSVAQYKSGYGKFMGSITITSPVLRTAVADSAIQHMLQQQISTSKAVPAAGANTSYFVYLPPGIAVVQGGSRS